MNFIDIIIGILLVLALYKGFKRGIIIEIATLTGLWLGLWGSFHFSVSLLPFLQTHIHLSPSYLSFLSFLICFIIILFLVYVIGKLVQKIAEGMMLGFLNKLAGAFFNCFKYILLISTFLFLIKHLPVKKPVIPSKYTGDSVMYPYIYGLAPLIIPSLEKFTEELSAVNY